jgi:predicted sulfurtransferase
MAKKRVEDYPNEEKRCTNCHTCKNTSEFYISELGVGSWCKVCMIENTKSRRNKSKNQEKITMEKLLEKITKLEIEISDLKSSSNDSSQVSCF